MVWKASALYCSLLLSAGSRSSFAFASNETPRCSSSSRRRHYASAEVEGGLLLSPLRGGSSTAAMMSSKNETEISTFGGQVGAESLGDADVRSESTRFVEATTLLDEAADVQHEHKPLKIVFLSSDTGGGHRASAEALAKQFLLKYPGSTYELIDVWTDHGVLPYRTLVNTYKRMSANPWQWRLFYHLSNTKLNQASADLHSRRTCGNKIKRRLQDAQPDLVISVHPAMNFTPMKETRQISRELGKHIPFYTVVTDLGSAHMMWFQKDVDAMYVASERLRAVAKRQAKTPDENIKLIGLPIRHDFAVQAEKLHDRTSDEGKAYQQHLRTDVLNIQHPNKKMVLIMGGGEGVGGLSDIVDRMYIQLTKSGVDATICVVCGRNDQLREDLLRRNWTQILADGSMDVTEQQKRGRLNLFRRRRRRQRQQQQQLHEIEQSTNATGEVDVIGLGFVTNMAEYMAASDVLVTKAGPGTIAEAASVGLPVMLTSFLPGQEAGNVEVVLESGYGAYNRDPVEIGNTVAAWLLDEEKMQVMSKAATKAGNPYAAAEIVDDIGGLTQDWIRLNSIHGS